MNFLDASVQTRRLASAEHTPRAADTMSDNLSSFMNLPRLEQLFGQLMAQLAQQEGEIAALKDRCAAAETTAARVGDLEAQLLRLETVAALPGGGSLGRRVVENGAAVARLADVVDRLGRDVGQLDLRGKA